MGNSILGSRIRRLCRNASTVTFCATDDGDYRHRFCASRCIARAAGRSTAKRRGSVVLVGSVGGGGFAQFCSSPEWGKVTDPMDRYTERVIGTVACAFDACAIFPQQGPPWWPFQRWASRAEAVFPSPLQILIHPQHGLWHAYRAALIFDTHLVGMPGAEVAKGPNPCAQCRVRPCLSACPVGAFDEHGFDCVRCEDHLRSPAGRSCLDRGCAARNACPVAPQRQYCVAQKQFHMRAFSASASVCAAPSKKDTID
jgi:hypothetical protein